MHLLYVSVGFVQRDQVALSHNLQRCPTVKKRIFILEPREPPNIFLICERSSQKTVYADH